MSRQITLEQKMKAMQEVQRIYDLSKKWQRPPGHSGPMPNFRAMADTVMKRALDAEVVGDRLPLDIRDGKLMHEHDSRTGRIIERTLRNGVIHPDVLHSFQSGRTKQPPQGDPFGAYRGRLPPDPDLPDVDLYVQHSDLDLDYPSHFVPGEGFVPKTHMHASHVLLAPPTDPPIQVDPAPRPTWGRGAGLSQGDPGGVPARVPTQQAVVRPQAGQGYV